MKIGITSNVVFNKLGFSAYDNIKKAGFSCIDFNMQRGFYDADKEKFELNDKNIINVIGLHLDAIQNAGLDVSQTHAPYYFKNNQLASWEAFESYFHCLELSIYATALLKCRYMVLHPLFVLPWMVTQGVYDNKQLTHFYVERLLNTAEKYNVYIALENLPYDFCNNSVSHKNYINMMKSRRVVACLDIGHTFIPQNDTITHIVEMKDIIKVLHVHDNDGKKDFHSRLETSNRDWNSIVNTLNKLGGIVFSLETSGIYKMCSREDILVELVNDFNSVARLFTMNYISMD